MIHTSRLGHLLLLRYTASVDLSSDLDQRAATAAAGGKAIVDAHLLQAVCVTHLTTLRASAADRLAWYASEDDARGTESTVTEDLHVATILHTRADGGHQASTSTGSADITETICTRRGEKEKTNGEEGERTPRRETRKGKDDGNKKGESQHVSIEHIIICLIVFLCRRCAVPPTIAHACHVTLSCSALESVDVTGCDVEYVD